MSAQKSLRIGLFGFGVVGEGIYQVLRQTPSLDAEIVKICIRDPEKKRNAPAELFTTRASEILDDPSLNVIVELISDPEAAFEIVGTALRRKKAVVSASKAMIAHNLRSLLNLQQHYRTPLLYEGAVCGSIPVIRNLEEYYDNDLLEAVSGIVNGSTNYILTRVAQEGMDIKNALLKAQSLGFAESDPSLDISGKDAVQKLSLLLLHGYGLISSPDQHLCIGIDRLHPMDLQYAREKNWPVKLCAQIRRLKSGNIAAFVAPQFQPPESLLSSVHNEYNGVVLQSSFADRQFFYGKGAGRFPTASAVLSDLSALRYQYRYEYRKLHYPSGNALCNNYYLRVYISYDPATPIDLKELEWIEEFNKREGRQMITGVIAYKKLLTAPWRKDPGVSVLLMPDCIVEERGEKEGRQDLQTQFVI